MRIRPGRHLSGMIALMVLVLALGALDRAHAQQELLVDGDFELMKSGRSLRADNEGQDWYESRKDKAGRKLLKLSKKKIYGNATRKAMIKADPELRSIPVIVLTEKRHVAVDGRRVNPVHSGFAPCRL